MKEEIRYEDIPVLTDDELLASGLTAESLDELSNNRGDIEEVEVAE